MKNSIKILGAYGAKTINTAMTCVQVDDEIVIDGGNILHGLDKDAKKINHIFITHTHLDHLVDIPFLIDIYFESRTKPLMIYGLQGTIDTIKKHIFNWDIWPDFSNIDLTIGGEKSVVFQVIEVEKEITINGISLKPIKTNHTDSSCGYVITKGDYATFFTSDTYKCHRIWDEVNGNPKIKSLIIDVSFPSILGKLAFDSRHLTPELLVGEIENLKREDVKIFINHIKPVFLDEIQDEIKTRYPELLKYGQILKDGDMLNLASCEIKEHLTKTQQDKIHINQLIDIGYSLTSEKNFDILMEKILVSSKKLSNADGGTLYLVSDDEKGLEFTVVETDSLGIKMGGQSGAITWPNLKLYNDDGSQNWEQVAALCAISGKLINIEDVYEAEGFNFEGTKKFDAGTGYRTKSMLVVPMKDHENKVIGVLQLLNKLDDTQEIITFTPEDERLLLSMASQAAVSISNNRLIASLEKLLMDFIKSTADAISEKSKYTGGHINRVAEIATTIAKAINEDTKGAFRSKKFTEDELQQLDIAAWMHDIGKITTPEYVVDKATKLETIYDRIETVICKCEILKRDSEIAYLKSLLSLGSKEEKEHFQKEYESTIATLDDDIAFLKIANKGSEYMSDLFLERIEKIATRTLVVDSKEIPLLSENERYNLSIRKGTLTQEERTVINNHVVVSYNMLNKLTFPKKLKRIPVIAGSHHKTIYTKENGRHGGYGAEDIMKLPMSLEDRILAVADVFEAVTASDRPYKEPNSLNQSLRILANMAKNDELDYTLVKFFIDNKIYEEYSVHNLKKEQMDPVTVSL